MPQFLIEKGVLTDAISISNEVFPDEIITIANGTSDNYVFQASKESLQQVTFTTNSKLESIGEYAFLYCSNLMKVDLSKCSKCQIIYNRAFSRCFKLTEFILPPSIRTLDTNVFRSSPITTTFDLSSLVTIFSDSFANTSLSFICSSNPKMSFYENNIYSAGFETLYFVSFSTHVLNLHKNTKSIRKCAFFFIIINRSCSFAPNNFL